MPPPHRARTSHAHTFPMAFPGFLPTWRLRLWHASGAAALPACRAFCPAVLATGMHSPSWPGCPTTTEPAVASISRLPGAMTDMHAGQACLPHWACCGKETATTVGLTDYSYSADCHHVRAPLLQEATMPVAAAYFSQTIFHAFSLGSRLGIITLCWDVLHVRTTNRRAWSGGTPQLYYPI